MSTVYGNRSKGPYYDTDWHEPFVRFECRHESEVSSVVMAVHRRVKAGLGVGLCPECNDKKRAEEHKKNAEAQIVQSVALALEEGLSPLEGTRAQVEWAEKLRADFFRALDQEDAFLHLPFYTIEEREEANEILDAVRAEAKEQTEAKHWIDALHREDATAQIMLLSRETLERLREMHTKEGNPRFAPIHCGHDDAIHLFGPRQKLFCDACQQQIIQRKLGRGAMEVLSVAGYLSQGLTPLDGTDKQVAWAEKIRDKFFYAMLKQEKIVEEGVSVRRVCREALRQKKATWWIEQVHRDSPLDLYADIKKWIETGAPLPQPTREPTPQQTPPPQPARKSASGLPPLQGTEKQVAWAERIRVGFFRVLAQHEKTSTKKNDVAKAAQIRHELEAQTNASWWIGSASKDDPERHLRELVAPTKK